MQVIPVAGRDSMLLNLSGAHGAFFTRNIVIITDSAGNPIMIGTKSGNANIMKNDAKDPQWRTLGVAVVKAKSVRVDKKVQVQRNGATVGKDGTASDPVGVTVGEARDVTVTFPAEYGENSDFIEFFSTPDGRIEIALKNIGAIENR